MTNRNEEMKYFARKITYWYKTAKENRKCKADRAADIAKGKGEAYTTMARDFYYIDEHEYELLMNAYNKLW